MPGEEVVNPVLTRDGPRVPHLPMASPPHILLTQKLTGEQEARLRALAPDARFLSESDLAREPALVEQVAVCWPRLPGALWHTARRLQWLQSDMAGVDTLLRLPGVAGHPALITNVHIHGSCIAEHLWGMTFMLTRNLHRALRQQDGGTWNSAPLSEGLSSLAGRTLCIAGLGAIGERCAAVGRTLGMRVIGIRRRPRPSPFADEVVGPGERREAFSRSRVVMVLLPDTPEARGFVGKEEMGAMRGAFLLNGGRGSSLDTAALVDALAAGRVRGAGLDVTDPELLPPGHPLWTMPNVIITPHYAGVHPGYVADAFEVFISNLARWLRGEPLENVVDRERGY
jgi:D-2-hydroxyacid dehydrogenase (NADP+)